MSEKTCSDGGKNMNRTKEKLMEPIKRNVLLNPVYHNGYS